METGFDLDLATLKKESWKINVESRELRWGVEGNQVVLPVVGEQSSR